MLRLNKLGVLIATLGLALFASLSANADSQGSDSSGAQLALSIGGLEIEFDKE